MRYIDTDLLGGGWMWTSAKVHAQQVGLPAGQAAIPLSAAVWCLMLEPDSQAALPPAMKVLKVFKVPRRPP